MAPQSDVYAVPGRHSIIDTINPQTGLTAICGHTAAQVQAREPLAVRMTWDAWTAAAIARQSSPIVWLSTTADRYDEMLNVLPPAMWRGGAFLVGEPMDHDVATGRARYSAYWQRGGAYFEASRPITVAEMRAELAAQGGA